MITSSQCRAARALLDWTQPDLVGATGLSAVTIRSFERGGVMRDSNKMLLRLAFEKAGVIFIPENGGGAGVRLARGSDGPRASREQIDASAADVRSQAANAADDAMSGMDATKQEKADRRATLTDEPALVGRARGKGKSKREGH